MPAAYHKALTDKDYTEESGPKVFDPTSSSIHVDYIIKMKLVVSEHRRGSYYIRQGIIEGICDNIHDVLNEAYYT